MIRQARRLIVADFFLWNSWRGRASAAEADWRDIAGELSQALIAQRLRYPDLHVLVITDPLNRVYGAADHEAPELTALSRAGIPVVYTDLDRLPWSNRAYSPFAATFGPWIDRAPALRAWLNHPRFANPFDLEGARISARQFGRLLHFRANHRKVLIADDGAGRLEALVTSWNPSTASSAHANAAVRLSGEAACDALWSELSVVDYSLEGAESRRPVCYAALLDTARTLDEATRRASHAALDESVAVETLPAARWLTEGRIREALLEAWNALQEGDEARVAMFYLSDRAIIAAMRQAARRGARIRVILDYNRDAFGRTKNGVPNRPVAAELVRRTRQAAAPIAIRWADTHGEQFHLKAAWFTSRDSAPLLILGSANWTRRNLADLNLEANVALRGASEAAAAFAEAFDAAWDNRDGGFCRTLPYEALEEGFWKRFWKSRLYRVQEATGACTF